MPLYEIELSQTVVVEADDSVHAVQVAMESAAPELDRQEYEYGVATEIKNSDSLPPTWDDECLPFGGNGDMRIKELLHSGS